MKRITLLLFAIATVSGCNSKKSAATQNELTTSISRQEKSIPTLEYEANTRGFYRKMTISDKKIWVILERNGKPVETAITEADWNELVLLYQTVNKESLKDLKAPTEKRFYDGAAMANFSVITNEATFRSATFDSGYPPAEIEKIVNKMIAIGQKVH